MNIPVKVRREKRRIHNRAAKAFRDLDRALQDMRQFLDDYAICWDRSEPDEFRIGNLKYDLSDLSIRASAKAEHPVDQIIHTFNLLSED